MDFANIKPAQLQTTPGPSRQVPFVLAPKDGLDTVLLQYARLPQWKEESDLFKNTFPTPPVTQLEIARLLGMIP